MSSADQRVILVTGANKGIGFEAVRLLSEKLPSATILLGTRSLANGEAAIAKLQNAPDKSTSYSNIHPIVLDVTDKASIANAVEEVKSRYGRLDVLMNNSGISNVGGQYRHQQVLDVNLYGVRDCNEAFLPILSSGAALITVSSEVGSWVTSRCPPELQRTLLNTEALTWETLDDLARKSLEGGEASPWPAKGRIFAGSYGVSKALVSAYMRMFAGQHPELRVCVVCPGYCATDLNRFQGHRRAAQGGESVIWPILHPFEHGQFYQDGHPHSWNSPLPSWSPHAD